MMFDLTGKTALVCGGAGYLGLPASIKLAEQGADVVIADRDEDAARQAFERVSSKSPGTQPSWYKLDLAEKASIVDTVGTVADKYGKIDIMVNLAAASTAKTVDEFEPEDFEKTLNVNITGFFTLARETAGYMESGGSIILYSSMYGRVAPDPRIYEPPMKPNPIDYGAGKAGIDQMVRYLAVHWAPENIRVNGICPGPFPNIDKPAYKKDPGLQAFIKRLGDKVPMGRVGKREETAGAVVFLASGEASFITGQVLAIDGGWTAW